MLKMNKLTALVICFFLLVSFQQVVFSQSTGKISGKIVDDETNESLPGVNIVLEGTGRGAATNINGEYFIINVPPGSYNLVCSMVGYSKVVVKEVKVQSNRTTVVDFNLKMQVVTGEEVTIVAQRPVIQKDVAGTEMVLDEESVQAFAQDAFSDFLSTQVGVNFTSSGDENGISIRGGDVSETNVLINGMSTRNAFSKQAQLGVAMSSIKEVSISSGGFTAEYGDVRSGLVNVVTKEGSRSHYSFSIDARMGPTGQKKYFGDDPYSINGPVWQIWAGPYAFSGVTEEWIEFLNMDNDPTSAVNFDGWNDLVRDYLLANGGHEFTPQQYLDRWRWEHRNVEYANKPDYILDGSLGGPVPFIPNATFLIAEHYENLQMALPLENNNSVTSTSQANFTFRLSPSMKLTWSNIYSHDSGFLARRSDFALTGFLTGNRASINTMMDAMGSASDARDFNLTTLPNVLRKTKRTGLLFSHAISPSTFYTFQIDGHSYDSKGGYDYPNDWLPDWPDGPKVRIGNDWRPLAPYSKPQLGVSSMSIDGITNIAGEPMSHDDSEYKQFHIKGLLESQVNYYNQLKLGFEGNYTDYDVFGWAYYASKGPFSPPLFQTDNIPNSTYLLRGKPIEASAFIQDKLEFEGMIANIGVRWDYFNAQQPAWNVDGFSDYYTYDNWITDPFYSAMQDSSGKNASSWNISPRLGVSFPATTTSKFYFNYGHFYQSPLASNLLALHPAKSNTGGKQGNIPNMNAEWPRTVSYEVGFEKAFLNDFLFRVSGYYKDITNELGNVNYMDDNGMILYQTFDNVSYRDIRGIELRLQQRQGRFGFGWIDFEYRATSSGLSGREYFYSNSAMQSESDRFNAVQPKNWPVPRISFVYNFRLPKEFGPRIVGFSPLSDWSLQLNGSWSDGGKRLFNEGAEWYLRHYIDVIDRNNLDLILKKRFTFGYFNTSIYMRMTNVFNDRGFYNYAESDSYMESLLVPWKQGDQQGDDKWGEGPLESDHIYGEWRTWHWYTNPRNILIGLELTYR